MALRNRGGEWHYRFEHQGREYSGATGLAATKRNVSEAHRLEAARRLAVKDSRLAPGSIPFSAGAAKFITWCRDVEYRSKEQTFHRIKTSFASLVAYFAETPIASITPGSVEDYKEWRIREHGVRDCTLRTDLTNLSLFFGRYAIKQAWATSNPVSAVKKPSSEDAVRMHVVTADEELTYFAAAWRYESKNLHDVARLVLLQGCRPEEIMSLRPDDVDISRTQLHVRGGKTRAARRTLDLVGESVAIMERRLADPLCSGWLFPSPRYESRHIVKVNARHDEVCRDAGVAFVLYDFRHTFATRMVEAGCDLPTLAAILGHASLRMVMKYVHPTAQHRKAAMDRYEKLLTPALKAVGE